MRSKLFSSILFTAITFGFLGSVLWLIQLRFDTGQSYPKSSSLRADPIGTKALFESFTALGRLRVERNFTPFGEMQSLPTDSVLLMLGVSGRSLHDLAQYASIKDFVAGGGRLVVALNPGSIAYKYIEDEERVDDPGESDDSESAAPFARRTEENQKEFLGELDLVHGKHEGGNATLKNTNAEKLPRLLPWREGGVLSVSEDDWVSLYEIDGEVVLAERTLGQGSIVLLTDNYLFSNEALLKHRSSDFLIWLLGNAQTVIFDETHLGVAETTGVAKLIRRYKLDNFALACALLLGVIVWRGISPLLPHHTGRSIGNTVFSTHSTEAGLSDLVRRSVPATDLPREAFAQWKQSFIRNSADQANYAKEVEAVNALLAQYAESSKRKPQELHLKIQNIINLRRKTSHE